MKLLRKIAPLAIAALMLGTTAAAADLASWKASFPGTDTAIVVGAGAAAQDTLGAVHIANALGVSGGGEAPVEGAWLVEAPGNDLNYGDDFGDIDANIDDTDLPTLLAEGTYRESRGNTENEETYTQKLIFDDDTSSDELTDELVFDAEEEAPEVADTYLYLDDGEVAFYYELKFDNPIEYDTTDTDTLDEDFELTKLKMLGREYTIVDAKDNGGDNVVDELVLMAGALKASQWEYSKATYTLADKTYEVEVRIISDDDSTAVLVINGEETDEMEEGDTYTLEDGTRIGVVDVIPNEGAEKSTGTSEGNDMVTFYLGAEKIVFEDDKEVEVNGVAVEGSDVQIPQLADGTAAGELDEISLSLTPDDNVYLTKGESFVEPILGRFKYTFQGLEKETEDITVQSSGDDGEIVLENNGGDELTIPVVFDDANGDVYPGDEIVADYQTNQNGNGLNLGGNLLIDDGDDCDGDADGAGDITDCEGVMFLAVSEGGEARIIEITDIDVDDPTVNGYLSFKDITTGKVWDDLEYVDGVDTDFDLGFMEVVLNVDETGGSEAIDFNTINRFVGDAGGDVNFETSLAGEMEIMLADFDGDGDLDVGGWTYDSEGNWLGDEWYFQTDGDPTPDMIVTVDDAGLVCGTGTSCPAEDDSDFQTAIDGVDYGAIFKWDTENDDDLTITYPEEQVYAKAYVSEVLTTIPELATGGATGAATPVLDTDVDDIKDMNLVVIGGSGINRVAAEMLDLEFPAYGSQAGWTDATKVDAAGKAIIKLMDSPYTTGKFAMLVAGWEGVDTERAAKALKEGTPAISGQSALLNTATSTVTVITA